MGQICMTDAGTTQDNFILRNRTIPIILPGGKNILVDTMFKIIIGHTNLDMRQLQGRRGSRVCPFVTSNANMAGYPTKHNVFFGKM